MAALAARKFTVEVANELEPISRASRRVVINAALLKQANLYAGDVVALVSSDPSKVSNASQRCTLRGPCPLASFSCGNLCALAYVQMTSFYKHETC